MKERIKTATAALNYDKKVKAKTDWHYGTYKTVKSVNLQHQYRG